MVNRECTDNDSSSPTNVHAHGFLVANARRWFNCTQCNDVAKKKELPRIARVRPGGEITT